MYTENMLWLLHRLTKMLMPLWFQNKFLFNWATNEPVLCNRVIANDSEIRLIDWHLVKYMDMSWKARGMSSLPAFVFAQSFL